LRSPLLLTKLKEVDSSHNSSQQQSKVQRRPLMTQNKTSSSSQTSKMINFYQLSWRIKSNCSITLRRQSMLSTAQQILFWCRHSRGRGLKRSKLISRATGSFSRRKPNERRISQAI